MVLGSHGRRGFDRLTMGSVSEHVAMHSPCSVEVIRGPVGAERQIEESFKEGSKTMRVVDVMMGTPYHCRPETNLGSATELMWTGNCGFLPVVRERGKSSGHHY